MQNNATVTPALNTTVLTYILSVLKRNYHNGNLESWLINAIYWGGALMVLRKIGSTVNSLANGNSKKKIRQEEKIRKDIKERTGEDKQIFLTSFESDIADDIIYPDQIEETFDDIGGLEDIKSTIEELVVLPLKRPDIFQDQGQLLNYGQGILLYGPPGTGKTLLAKAIAKGANVCFINLKLSTIQNKWFGQSQKYVKAVFTLAQKVQPCVLFMDEIDSFFRSRTSNDHEPMLQIKSEFMSLWDGISSNNKSNIIMLGATNRPGDVDKAILRRMPRTFEVQLPNHEKRVAILKLILKDENLADDIDYDKIAKKTHTYSGSDLKALCRAAATRPVHDFVVAEKNGEIQEKLRNLETEDFLLSTQQVKPSTNQYQIY